MRSQFKLIFTALGLAGALLCSPAVHAQTGPVEKRHNVLPDPFHYIEPDCVAWGVVLARPEDKGFQALLRTAWQGLQANPGSNAGWLSMLTAVLSQSKQEDFLLGFLPFQGVHMVRLDDQGVDHYTSVMTLSGWPGLQSLFWGTLQQGPDGQPFKTREVAGETVVLRPKPGQDAAVGPAAARIKGSFLAFSDFLTAQRSLSAHEPSGEAYEIARKLDASQDTLGVILNRKDSLSRFMDWLNAGDMRTIATSVGADRLKTDLAMIDYVSWTGDLMDDDKMELVIRFHSLGESQAEELQAMLQIARQALKAKGRAADLDMTTMSSDVIVRVQMTGYKPMLLNFLRNPNG